MDDTQSKPLTQQLQYVAHLARLELTPQEIETFSRQLAEVLNYFDALSGVDVSKIEPLTHPLDLPTALREDVIRPFGSAGPNPPEPKILKHAPDVLHGSFKVPQVL